MDAARAEAQIRLIDAHSALDRLSREKVQILERLDRIDEERAGWQKRADEAEAALSPNRDTEAKDA